MVNLFFTAGTTIDCTLDPKKALQSVTLSATKILGIDDRLGSIEVAKEARLFVSEGGALKRKKH